jgi:hypothetical protein
MIENEINPRTVRTAIEIQINLKTVPENHKNPRDSARDKSQAVGRKSDKCQWKFRVVTERKNHKLNNTCPKAIKTRSGKNHST